MKRTKLLVLFMFLAVSAWAADDYRMPRRTTQWVGYTDEYPTFSGGSVSTSITTSTASSLPSFDSQIVYYSDTSTDTLSVTHVWLQPTVDIRWTTDNSTDPTSSTGLLLEADSTLKLLGNQARWFSCIGASSPGTLNVQYWGWPDNYAYPHD